MKHTSVVTSLSRRRLSGVCSASGERANMVSPGPALVEATINASHCEMWESSPFFISVAKKCDYNKKTREYIL